MTALLIVAHAPLASALLAAAQHVYAERLGTVAALDIQPEQSAEHAEASVRAALARLAASGDATDTLVLTDVFGATPCNTARQLADRAGVRLVAGVNVPMLWRALNYASEPLDTLVTRALAGGTQGVMQIAASRPQNQASQPTSHDQDHRQHQQ